MTTTVWKIISRLFGWVGTLRINKVHGMWDSSVMTDPVSFGSTQVKNRKQ